MLNAKPRGTAVGIEDSLENGSITLSLWKTFMAA
jgi:hypothetical protein